jgi:hypothetical protein
MPATERSDPPSKLQQRRPSAKASILKLARQIHLYIGLFTAPALLFFAFSGALQTFSLHKAKGGDYKPANWIAIMGELHKNQTAQLPLPKSQLTKPVGSAATEPVSPSARSSDLPVRHPLPLKIFFVVASLSFFFSVLTGVYMAYNYSRNKTLVASILLAGLVIPILLTFV